MKKAIIFFYHPNEKIPGTLYKIGCLEDILKWFAELKETFKIDSPNKVMGKLIACYAKTPTPQEWEPRRDRNFERSG